MSTTFSSNLFSLFTNVDSIEILAISLFLLSSETVMTQTEDTIIKCQEFEFESNSLYVDMIINEEICFKNLLVSHVDDMIEKFAAVTKYTFFQ